LITISSVPLALVVTEPAFSGTPGQSNCHGKSVSTLNRRFGNMPVAAAALGLSSVGALQQAIQVFCDAR
jgi:hypothetical protein